MSSTGIASLLILSLIAMPASFSAQDATGAIRGTVLDSSGSRIAQASIVIVNTATGRRYAATCDAERDFALDLLPPGDYSARVVAQGMAPQVTPQLHVDIGAVATVEFHLTIAGAQENVNVSAAPTLVETQPAAVSTLLDERALNAFPLNGRALPAGFTQGVTKRLSAFAPNFVTPRVQQASLTLEKEVVSRTTVALSLLSVHGEHLIRALDVNLAQPTALTYPIFDSTGSIFQGGYYTVDSFATWQFTRSLTCPFPPCINPLGRPIAQLGAINEFQSAASSYYNGGALHQSSRLARNVSPPLLHLCSRHRPRPGRLSRRPTRHRPKFLRARRRARTQR